MEAKLDNFYNLIKRAISDYSPELVSSLLLEQMKYFDENPMARRLALSIELPNQMKKIMPGIYQFLLDFYLKSKQERIEWVLSSVNESEKVLESLLAELKTVKETPEKLEDDLFKIGAYLTILHRLGENKEG